jgi:SAM-dependent methyltransferase
MLTVDDQLATDRLVCPVTRLPLRREGEKLVTPGGENSYHLVRGVPILLPSPDAYLEFRDAADSALHDAGEGIDRAPGAKRMVHRLLAWGGDRRTAASREAFRRAIAEQPPGALCLSIGGGPSRPHPALVNLNIGPFENVDLVGDAHALPYADGAVDAIYCEAVLEHLERPELAVAEMDRVLKAGGLVFAATPFLQRYHGHPDHYQNFTLTGHRRLFERVGFEIAAKGTCVGPIFALTALAGAFAREFVPTRLLSRAAWLLVGLVAIPLRWFDRFLPATRSHVLASSTFVLARKGEAG